jgi:hypothetical protein
MYFILFNKFKDLNLKRNKSGALGAILLPWEMNYFKIRGNIDEVKHYKGVIYPGIWLEMLIMPWPKPNPLLDFLL